MKYMPFVVLMFLPNFAFGVTCTVGSLPNGVSGQAPDTPVTCDGKSGFIFLSQIPSDSRQAGALFTVTTDLTVYSNLNETPPFADAKLNPVVAHFNDPAAKPAAANAAPVCTFKGSIQLLNANVPNDAGNACKVQICEAAVQCQVNGATQAGRVTHLPLSDGTCPSDMSIYIADNVFSSQKVAYKDPAVDSTATHLPTNGTPNCAYASISLLKGNIPGCGNVTLCDPKFTCSKSDSANATPATGVSTFDIHGTCGFDPSTKNTPTAGCFADANKCAGDDRTTFSVATTSGAAGNSGKGGSGSGSTQVK